MKAEYSSKVFTKAVDSFASLSGIGRKTAVRLVLDLLKQNKENILYFSKTFADLANEISYCEHCHNLSDTPCCVLCADPSREQSVLCVVEDVRDVIAIENTAQFKGKYHVLGGLISPIKGIHPSHLTIASLVQRIEKSMAAQWPIQEIILALRTDIEGDTTHFYLYKQLKDFKMRITTLARGIGLNDEIQYADELTLGKSILHRVPLAQAVNF